MHSSRVGHLPSHNQKQKGISGRLQLCPYSASDHFMEYFEYLNTMKIHDALLCHKNILLLGLDRPTK